MNQRLTSPSKEPAPQTAYLSEPERLLERAKNIVHGAPAGLDLTLTLSMGKHGDSIHIQVDSAAPMEQRCGLVDWFAAKLNPRHPAGAPMLGESGTAWYRATAEFGENRGLYVNVTTQITKAEQ